VKKLGAQRKGFSTGRGSIHDIVSIEGNCHPQKGEEEKIDPKPWSCQDPKGKDDTQQIINGDKNMGGKSQILGELIGIGRSPLVVDDNPQHETGGDHDSCKGNDTQIKVATATKSVLESPTPKEER
jgi:hypothetical protein